MYFINFRKFLLLIFLSLFFSSSSFSHLSHDSHDSHSDNIYNILSVGTKTLSSYPALASSVKKATILKINKEELDLLCDNKNPEIILNIPFGNNESAELNLSRQNILSPDAKIVARTATGNQQIFPDDLAVSYSGYIKGNPNSLVSVTFSRNNISGIIITQDGNYILGAVKDNDGNQTDDYILYKESDMKSTNPFKCNTGEELSSSKLEEMRNIITEKMKESLPTDLYVAEIAIEIDFITYNAYGSSVVNATNYALTLMAASSAIYMKEVNVRFVIPYVRVWSTPDIYNGTTSNALLNQFRNEWNTNQQIVQRTLAHFITVRGDNLGGIAYLNALCSSTAGGFGYGFSNTYGPILPLPTYSWDVFVISHELGHNFGSNHTHNCGWVGGAIDSCYETEGGCYTGPPVSNIGTIMSYCHLNGSISLVKGFGPQPKALIRSRAENAGCMYVSPRSLLIGYPNGGETFRTGNNVAIYWGSSISSGNVNIELSLNGGTSWQTVQNNIPSNQNQYEWSLPSIPSTTQAKLRILDSSNPNTGDTTDAVFRIILNINTYLLISPPSLSRIDVSSTTTQSQLFSWSRGGTDPSIYYKFKIKKLGNNPEFIINSDNGGHDTTATIRKNLLDSIAQIMGTTGDSVRCTWRVFAFNGIDSAVSSNSFIVTLVRTNVGINILSSVIPDKFSLGNNYPNPFNPETTIKFDIARSTFAEMKIFDSKGSLIKTFAKDRLQPGSYEYKFDAGNLPSGVYFYRLKTEEFTQTKRMVLLK